MTQQVRVYLKFRNLSDVPASVYWISNQTERKLYCTLKPSEFVDINTFLGHCWIFEDANNGDCLLASGSCIFTPTRDYLLKSIRSSRTCYRLTRKVLFITRPLYTLKGLSFNAVRDTNISVLDAESLVLPKTVKDELMHILKKRDCLVLHRNNCLTCPFDLHKAHFNHTCTMASCLNLLKPNSTGRLVRLPHKRLTCIRANNNRT